MQLRGPKISARSPLERQADMYAFSCVATPDHMKGYVYDLAVHAQVVMRAITVIACTARSCDVLLIKNAVATKENT